MSTSQLLDPTSERPLPRGQLFGFAETHGECMAICQALADRGFEDSNIRVLCGNTGIHLLIRMMTGSRWGDVGEDVLRQGLIELDAGHWVLIVNVVDRQEAQSATETASSVGGYGFTHLDFAVDEPRSK